MLLWSNQTELMSAQGPPLTAVWAQFAISTLEIT